MRVGDSRTSTAGTWVLVSIGMNAELRRERETLDLTEKVRLVLELQRLYWPLLQRHRRPEAWESPWTVTP